MSHNNTGVPRLPEPPPLWTPNYMREFIRVMVIWMRAQTDPDEEELGEGSIQTITTDSLMGTSEGTMLADASSGYVTVTLPDPSTVVGRFFRVKKIDTGSNYVIVVGNSCQIERQGGWYLSTPYSSVTVQSDGYEYWIVSTVAGGTDVTTMPATASLEVPGELPA